MDSEKPRSFDGLITRMVCSLLGGLLLYVLSLGPVAYLHVKSPGSRSLVEKFFAPALWTIKGTPLNRPLHAYVEFWLRRAGASDDD